MFLIFKSIMVSTKKRLINTKAVPTVAFKNKFKNKFKFKKKFKDPWEKYKGKLNVKGVKFLKKINGDCHVCTVTVKYYKGTGCGMGYHFASSVKTGIGGVEIKNAG